MLGAWGGHVVAAADAPPGIGVIALRRRQLPLAVVMVGLTTLTLWSLGQAILVTPQAASIDLGAIPQAGAAVRTDAGTH
jgi:hypothetical protein